MIFVFAEHSNTTAGSRSGIITIFPTFRWPNISYCCSESHVYMRLVYDCSKGGEVLLVFGDTRGTNGQVCTKFDLPTDYRGLVLVTVSTYGTVFKNERFAKWFCRSNFKLELALWQGKSLVYMKYFLTQMCFRDIIYYKNLESQMTFEVDKSFPSSCDHLISSKS